ncbi:hypothetical protein P5V15_000903 [Pogonomyrmex californicus]
MMAIKFVIIVLLFVACSYASPLRMASIYGSPLFIVVTQELDDPQAMINEEPIYALSDDSKVADNNANSNIEKRSAEEADDDDDDLETAAGTNVLRPLFVYRQQVAYRQRVRDAIRRGRRI